MRLADGVEVDLHRDFSSPLPTFRPRATYSAFRSPTATDSIRGSAALTTFQDAGFALRGLSAPDAVAEMFEYFSRRDHCAPQASPGDDLISALCHASVDGEMLTDWDILGFCFVIVAGGNDTTGNLISHGVHAARPSIRRSANCCSPTRRSSRMRCSSSCGWRFGAGRWPGRRPALSGFTTSRFRRARRC